MSDKVHGVVKSVVSITICLFFVFLLPKVVDLLRSFQSLSPFGTDRLNKLKNVDLRVRLLNLCFVLHNFSINVDCFVVIVLLVGKKDMFSAAKFFYYYQSNYEVKKTN